jgi:EAL and modified HD-GYP domain-containing signal transduction protein
MDQLLEEISLAPDIKAALTDPRNPNAIWCELLAELDRGNWGRLEVKVAAMGIPMELVDRVSIEAEAWTEEVMGAAV